MRNVLYLAVVVLSLGCGAISSVPAPTSAPGRVTIVATQAPPAPTAGSPATTVAPTARPTAVVAPTVASTSSTKQLGDVARQGGLWAAAVRVESLSVPPNRFVTIEAGHKLTIVELIVGNDSDTPVSVNPLNATLVDAEGFVAQAKLAGAQRQIETVMLGRGERVRGEIAFEVPATSTAAKLRYSASAFGSQSLELGLAGQPGPASVILPERVRPQYPKLGAMGENSGYTVVVSAFEDSPKPSLLYQKAQGYRLVAAEITVGNGTDKPLSVNPLYSHLVDTNGFVWGLKLGGRDGAQLDATKIGKGEKARGWVAFDIPADSVPDAIRVDNDNIFNPIWTYAGVR